MPHELTQLPTNKLMRSNTNLHILIPSLLFSTVLFFSTVGLAQTAKSAKDYLHIPGPIAFENHAYNLSWSAHPAANFYKQEYIANGDQADKFKSMVLIDVVTGENKC